MSSDAAGFRAVRFLAVVVMMTGVFGVAAGSSALEIALGGAAPALIEPERGTAVDMALFRLNQAVAHEVRGQGRMRHAIGVANLPVSALLIVAAVMLFLRRPNAVWWTTNAAIANGLWSAAESALDAVQLRQAYPKLLPLLSAWQDAQRAAAPGRGEIPTPEALLDLYSAVFLAYGAARVVYYLLILWFSSRSAVRASLSEPAQHSE